MIKNCTPIIIAFFVHITFLVNAQNNCGEESQQIYFMMEKHHIMDISPDDSLSISVYDEILEALDPYGLIFLQSDIDSLSKFTYAFFRDVGSIGGNRISRHCIKSKRHFILLFRAYYLFAQQERSKEAVSEILKNGGFE
jgi:hypothetical protein